MRVTDRKCKFAHDIPAYLAAKLHDLRIPDTSEISDSAPFIEPDRAVRAPHPKHPSLDLGTVCPVFAETGECRYAFLSFGYGEYVPIESTIDMASSAGSLVHMYAQTTLAILH